MTTATLPRHAVPFLDLEQAIWMRCGNEEDYGLDADAAAKRDGVNTRYPMPVHLYGQLADMRSPARDRCAGRRRTRAGRTAPPATALSRAAPVSQQHPPTV